MFLDLSEISFISVLCKIICISLQILKDIIYDCFSNTSIQQIKWRHAIMTREMVDWEFLHYLNEDTWISRNPIPAEDSSCDTCNRGKNDTMCADLERGGQGVTPTHQPLENSNLLNSHSKVTSSIGFGMYNPSLTPSPCKQNYPMAPWKTFLDPSMKSKSRVSLYRQKRKLLTFPITCAATCL